MGKVPATLPQPWSRAVGFGAARVTGGSKFWEMPVRLRSGSSMWEHTVLDWKSLLSGKRVDELVEAVVPQAPPQPPPSWLVETRTPAERDYDRVRFAAPVRRLADKTQVFPLERNDSVRNRLTHSDEVSALARSAGTHLAHVLLPEQGETGHERTIPAILAAAGLAHDLGNPPFGHQGEEAIRRWFSDRKSVCFGEFEDKSPPQGGLDVELEGAREMRSAVRSKPNLREDFLRFEGNAQTMRLLMRLQASTNGFGLNLTCGTLGALMKYVVASNSVRKGGPPGGRKPGFFASEAAWIGKIKAEVGLPDDVRHPLAYVLEACDDIAYSVIDTEDSVKKGLVSFPDLIDYLEAAGHENGEDEVIAHVVHRSREGHQAARTSRLSPSELNDVSMQKFRVHAIGAMVSALTSSWREQYSSIMKGGLQEPLLVLGRAAKLVSALKAFDLAHAFRHRDVLAIEVEGFNKIQDLMSMLWRGIVERESYGDPASKRTSPFADLSYNYISENYRKVFEDTARTDQSLPIRYRELQLLADMVSGMTDSYAVFLHRKLGEYHVGASMRKV